MTVFLVRLNQVPVRKAMDAKFIIVNLYFLVHIQNRIVVTSMIAERNVPRRQAHYALLHDSGRHNET